MSVDEKLNALRREVAVQKPVAKGSNYAVQTAIESFKAGGQMVAVKPFKFSGKMYAIGDSFIPAESESLRAISMIENGFVIDRDSWDKLDSYAVKHKFLMSLQPMVDRLGVARGELSKASSTVHMVEAALKHAQDEYRTRAAFVVDLERQLEDELEGPSQ